jgi:hypothetical protein
MSLELLVTAYLISLNLHQMEESCEHHGPAALSQEEKRPFTHWTGGTENRMRGVDEETNSRNLRVSNPTPLVYSP